MTDRFEIARLERRMVEDGPALRKVMLTVLLGRAVEHRGGHCTIGEADIRVSAQDLTWRVEREGRAARTGVGLIGMTACAFDISLGAAARIIIEMTTGSRLTPDAAYGVHRAINENGLDDGRGLVYR